MKNCWIFFLLCLPLYAGVLIPTGWSSSYITEKQHIVDITIDNQIATTKVTQSFHNSFERSLEAQYRFTLPDGAKIHSFAMWIKGKKMSGAVVENHTGRKIYEEITGQRRDPALLEHLYGNTYSIRIFPVEPNSLQKIELTYWQVLHYQEGTVDYLYPVQDLQRALLQEIEFAIQFRIHSNIAIRSCTSLSHHLEISEKSTNSIVASATAKYPLAQDFALQYQLNKEKTGLDIISYREGTEDGYFMALLTPETIANENEKIVPKAVTFVLDTSYSMYGPRIEQSKKALQQFLKTLREEDFFNIITFNTDVKNLYNKAIPASSENKAKAEKFIYTIQAAGSTNFCAAIEEALKPDTEIPHIVIVLSDGEPTTGITNFDEITQIVGEQIHDNACVFIFCIASQTNRMLMRNLCRKYRGECIDVNTNNNIYRQVSGVFHKIMNPACSQIHLDFGKAIITQMYPENVSTLFYGSQIMVTGRYQTPGKFTVTLRGSNLQIQEEIHFSENNPKTKFIQRLWQSERLDDLLYQIDQNKNIDEKENLQQEIISLSKSTGIITPYTSYLVLESEQQYQQYNLEPHQNSSTEDQKLLQSRGGYTDDEQSDMENRGKAVTNILPKKWSLQPEIQAIEQLFTTEFVPIIKILQDNSDNSKTADMLYHTSSVLEKSQEMQEIFKTTILKLGKFSGYLDYKTTELAQQVARYNQRSEKYKEQLLALVKRIKQTTNRLKKDEFTNEFRRIFNKFNINTRYQQGLSRNHEDYANLLQNLKVLFQAYLVLHLDFDTLYDDLTQLQKSLETLEPTQNFREVIKTDKILQRLLLCQQVMQEAVELIHKLETSPFQVNDSDIKKLTVAIERLRLQK